MKELNIPHLIKNVLVKHSNKSNKFNKDSNQNTYIYVNTHVFPLIKKSKYNINLFLIFKLFSCHFFIK